MSHADNIKLKGNEGSAVDHWLMRWTATQPAKITFPLIPL